MSASSLDDFSNKQPPPETASEDEPLIEPREKQFERAGRAATVAAWWSVWVTVMVMMFAPALVIAFVQPRFEN